MCVCVCVGDYYCGPPGESDLEPDEDWVKSLQDEGRAYQEWDEDADVDESGEPRVVSLLKAALPMIPRAVAQPCVVLCVQRRRRRSLQPLVRFRERRAC